MRSCRRLSYLFCILTSLISSGAWPQTVTLNLQDAEISALIGTVAEVTGKNFVVDPRVEGKVTVFSSRPLEKDEVYQVFLSVLKVHGFAAVPSGAVIKIVPEEAARADSTAVVDSSRINRGDELVTEVMFIEHVSAQQLVPVLRPLVPQQGHLAAYPSSNTLIVSDSAANIQRLKTIIKRIDVPTGTGIELIRLQHASAAEVVQILEALHSNDSQNEAMPAPKLVADGRSNSVLVSSDPSTRLKLRAVIAHLDTPLEGQGNTNVIYLRYANAKDLVPILEGVLHTPAASGDKSSATPSTEFASVQADDSINALVVTASPSVLKTLMEVVRQLDVRRAQVLVEAVIAEVTREKATELGVQWRATTDPSERGIFGGTNFSGANESINSFAADPFGNAVGLALGFIDGTTTFGGKEFLNVAALIRALASDATTNILSTPTLVTLDNEGAEIVIAENVPFVTGQFTVNAGSGSQVSNPFQTIERRDVGLILRLTPQINEGNAMRLDIEQELSRVIPSTAPSGAGSVGAVDLITNVRSLRTTVLVEDGEMLVLGGLLDDDVTQSQQKVPVLGDIPVLGHLFRFDSTGKRKRNLLIFLRPLILRDAVASKVSGTKYNYLRVEQLKERSAGIRLMPNDTAPLLPPLDIYLQGPLNFDSLEKSDRNAADKNGVTRE
ncbi:MAG: type II secretion system secretin GspD [Gammaproteobacteria bacterium]